MNEVRGEGVGFVQVRHAILLASRIRDPRQAALQVNNVCTQVYHTVLFKCESDTGVDNIYSSISPSVRRLAFGMLATLITHC